MTLEEVLEKTMKDYSWLRVSGIFRDPVVPPTRLDLVDERGKEFGFPIETEIPVGLVDSLYNSALKGTPSLEFHSLLSCGYMGYLKRSAELCPIFPFEEEVKIT